MREKEWLDWFRTEGHGYYLRARRCARHLRCLSRWDLLVLLHLRSGVSPFGHDDCEGGADRFHVLRCPRFAVGRPAESRLFNDRAVLEWKIWWTAHQHLGCGIPGNRREHDGHRVVGGNPFDGTLRLMDRGVVKTVVVPVDRAHRRDRRCVECGLDHVTAACPMKMVVIGKGKWWFVGDICRCGGCGQRFATRAALLCHLCRKSDSCGGTWEREV